MGNSLNIIELDEFNHCDLSNKNLTKIPPNIPMDTISLNLGNNEITKIENLDHLINLQVLNLENNQITKIECLENCIDLQVLILEKNQIQYSLNIYKKYNLDKKIIFFETEQKIKKNIYDNIKFIEKYLDEPKLIKNIIDFIY